MKLNCVIQEDNISQIVPLAQLAWENRIAVRFIELMPFGPGQKLKFISIDMVLTQLEKAFGLRSLLRKNWLEVRLNM